MENGRGWTETGERRKLISSFYIRSSSNTIGYDLPFSYFRFRVILADFCRL